MTLRPGQRSRNELWYEYFDQFLRTSFCCTLFFATFNFCANFDVLVILALFFVFVLIFARLAMRRTCSTKTT